MCYGGLLVQSDGSDEIRSGEVVSREVEGGREGEGEREGEKEREGPAKVDEFDGELVWRHVEVHSFRMHDGVRFD